MADNLTTQTTLSTVPSGTGVATDEVTYSGDTGRHIAPTSLVVISGAEGSKTATPVPAGGGVEANTLRVTIASDSTGLVSVDDNGGSLTVDGTVAVSGTVTVATHDVGSITTAVVPGTAATNLGKAEDAAHASGDVGVMALAVRQTSPANLSGAAGDYEPLQVNAGRLWASATIDAALPAGTNNIGDVDVLTVPAPLSTTGNGTAATALRVTMASDSTGIVAITGTAAVAEVRPASASLSNVAASATSVTLLASNANRKQATIYNDSTVALYAKFGATASATSFTVKIFGNGYYELPFPVYSGVIDGIWDSASGSARVTEVS